MEQKKDTLGTILIIIFLILLTIAGYLSYKSIDWDVLKKMESQPLILPTPIPASPSANISTNPEISTSSATSSSLQK
jgi:hypothetical protein